MNSRSEKGRGSARPNTRSATPDVRTRIAPRRTARRAGPGRGGWAKTNQTGKGRKRKIRNGDGRSTEDPSAVKRSKWQRFKTRIPEKQGQRSTTFSVRPPTQTSKRKQERMEEGGGGSAREGQRGERGRGRREEKAEWGERGRELEKGWEEESERKRGRASKRRDWRTKPVGSPNLLTGRVVGRR